MIIGEITDTVRRNMDTVSEFTNYRIDVKCEVAFKKTFRHWINYQLISDMKLEI